MTETLIETGLSSPIVSQEPVPQPQPMPPATLPQGWDTRRAFTFMRDMAQEMFPLSEILAKHGVLPAQYAIMEKNEHFIRILDAMKAEWNAAANTPKRLALEALVALEDKLPDMVSRMSKPTESLDAIVKLAALLAKIGGLENQGQVGGPSERFSITINLGADTEKFEKQRTPVIDAPEVQSITEGQGAVSKILDFSQGTGPKLSTE